MIEMTASFQNIAIDYKNKKTILSFTVNERSKAEQVFDNLASETKLKLTVDKHREKRSNNANAYAWKLINEIANATRESKEDVYIDHLKHYGQSEIVSVRAHVPVKDYFKYYEEVGEATLKGKPFKHYKIYKGSSEFDTREMSIFIEGIVNTAKDLGIETKTPLELAQMIAQEEAYGKKYNAK